MRREALLLLLLAACPSISTVQTAETVPPGHWTVGGAIGVAGYRDVEQGTRVPLPQLELVARRGLTPYLDAGVKLYLTSIELGAKACVHAGAWAFALAPSFAVGRTREGGAFTEAVYLYGHLAALAGRPLSDRFSIVLGPKLMWALFLPKNGGHADGWSVGGVLGVEIRFGRWALLPEVNAYKTAAGTIPTDGGALQFGIGILRDL